MSETTIFVYTMNRLGQVGAWTKYMIPFAIDDYTIAGEDMYLRSGDTIHQVNFNVETDEIIEGDDPTPFEWTVQWPWLDMGQMGVTKGMVGFDIVGYGQARIAFGYDQTQGGIFTPEWTIMADSVPGQLLPMPLAAPSLSVRVTYTGNTLTKTGLDALNLWFNDFRPTS